jgi:hypothetical protein
MPETAYDKKSKTMQTRIRERIESNREANEKEFGPLVMSAEERQRLAAEGKEPLPRRAVRPKAAEVAKNP